MNSNQNKGRLVGVLLLLVFIFGITIFQFLQGATLFSDDFLTLTAKNSDKIIGSVLLGILSGILSIIISIILLPIFKKYNQNLAYLYVAFCILNFITIMIDNYSVVSMLELSKAYTENENNVLQSISTIYSEKHWWTHYLYLLISCFPVFVLYYTLYATKLVPKIFPIIGLIAVVLMFVEELFSIFGNSISSNMLLPIGLIQLLFPLYLIFKGFNSKE